MKEKTLGNAISKNKKLAVISALICALLYSPIYFQDLWNPDSLNNSVFLNSDIWVQQMRWANQLWEHYVRGFYVLPGLTFAVACIALPIIVCLIVDMFELDSLIEKILVSIILIGSIHQVSCMTYAYCGDEFTIAYLLVVVATYLLGRNWERFSLFRYVLVIFLLMISLAMYQSYFAIGLILILVKFIEELFSERDAKSCFKVFFVQGLAFVISIICYIISVYISLAVCNTTISSYRNMDSYTNVNVEYFIRGIKDSYLYLYDNYMTNYLYSNDFYGRKWIHGFMFVTIGIILICKTIKNRKTMGVKKCGLLILAVICFPLFFNFTYFLTNTGVSFVMLPTMPYLYIVFIIAVKWLGFDGENSWLKYVINIPTFVIALSSLIIVGATISELKLGCDKARTLIIQIDYSIKSNEYYSQEVPVLIYGNYELGNYPDIYDYNYSLATRGTVHDFGQFWLNDWSSNQNCWNHLAMKYCGSYYNWCSDEQAQNIISSSEFIEMDNYPSNGSVKCIDGVLVVKLSECLR